ncbi:Rad9/Ddc1 [Syncephalastrum racemosum]|uniref:Rad9/Ddc1 n=1 Tax=Syncephalastrum racemosum TaxID=13706 RepID=A0A1X2HIE7_SYNRA|nr:Rad9/Ddc1 [Syncephalastrum racemosum]
MSFSAALSGDALRTFSRVLDTLASYGDELFLEIRKNQFILFTNNQSLTAQAIIRISPRFFEHYRLTRPRTVTIRDGQQHEVKKDSIPCRIFLKSIRTTVKHAQSTANPAKRCELSLKYEDQTVTTGASPLRLNLKLVYNDNVTKTLSLAYQEGDLVEELFTKDTPNEFEIMPGIVTDDLHNFHPRIQNVALDCTSSGIRIKSHWSGPISDQPLHCEFDINTDDFARLTIQNQVECVFTLKQFKTALLLAEDLNGNLSAYFSEPGNAIVFSTQLPEMIIADFAMMTSRVNDSDDTTQSTTTDDHSGISTITNRSTRAQR